MKTSNYTKECRETIARFEKLWSIDKVKSMTLDRFVSVDDRTTFCYWVETETRHVGSIKGSTSIKFGIYKPKKGRDISKITRFNHDHEYVWSKRFGDNQNEVFERIKGNIVSIIENAQSGNFEAIDDIDISHMFKWKIAFLYSNEKLLPIYNKDVVINECRRLGIKVEKKKFSSLIKSLYKKKGAERSVFDYMDEIFSRLRRKPNYYLLGCNYEQFKGDFEDVSPIMISENVISVGFENELSLEEYIGDEDGLKRQLKNKNAIQSSKNALLKFIKIKPGDIIALKKRIGVDQIIITAYAIVKDYENEVIYSHHKDLWHCFDVEFIETDVNKKLNLNKAHTLHKITKPSEITSVFGNYGNKDIQKNLKVNSGVDHKEERSYMVSTRAKTYIVNSIHDKLQNKLAEHLRSNYDKVKEVKLEKNFIDIKVTMEDGIIKLYEVKPYESPIYCIREALGQILYYSSLINEKIDTIAIAGPNELDEKAYLYFDYIKKKTTLPLQYISINNL